MLKNDYLVENFGVDTTENEPREDENQVMNKIRVQRRRELGALAVGPRQQDLYRSWLQTFANFKIQGQRLTTNEIGDNNEIGEKNVQKTAQTPLATE